jgi:redox-sensitive bicupin YhaK (pirin superfamily)
VSTEPGAGVDVRRGDTRARTVTPWLDSRHSFSFGPHYDPGNTSYGVLLAHNEDVLAPGTGFSPHPHRDVEIVTWVLSGALAHEDSAGRNAVVLPGVVQRLSAGTGVVHSERNDAWRLSPDLPPDVPTHLVQMWLAGDAEAPPQYEQRRLDERLIDGALTPVASGLPAHEGTGALSLRHARAALHVARLGPDQAVALPRAPYVHLFVTRGSVRLLGAETLDAGDAARVTRTQALDLIAVEPAEVLVWEMHEAT